MHLLMTPAFIRQDLSSYFPVYSLAAVCRWHSSRSACELAQHASSLALHLSSISPMQAQLCTVVFAAALAPNPSVCIM